MSDFLTTMSHLQPLQPNTYCRTYFQLLTCSPHIHAITFESQLHSRACVVAGMRCLSPNMNRWPSWADVFPNITLLPKIEAKTFIMHVSHALSPACVAVPVMLLNCHATTSSSVMLLQCCTLVQLPSCLGHMPFSMHHGFAVQ